MSISDRVEEPKLAIVIVAAGSSRRFGSDKLAKKLGGTTVLECAIATMCAAVPEAPVVTVVSPDRLDSWRSRICAVFPGIEVIAGGQRRQDSVRLGIDRATEWGAEIVAVHDGARPLVHPDDVVKVIDALGQNAAAILCGGVTDTIKRIDGDDMIVETIDRDRLRLAQTPQVLRIAALRRAWKTLNSSRSFSDEASMIEADGGSVRCVMADHPNLKLTTAGDLRLARLIVGIEP